MENTQAGTSHSNDVPKWSVPEKGCIKINTDASFFKETLRGFYGLIARNDKGEVLEARCGSLGFVESALHAEALAAAKAIEMARFFHQFQCVIEGDCMELVSSINNHGDTKETEVYIVSM
ncbi:hypothetical protein ACFE04_003466 [Oxalis oulophora]